MFRIKQLLFFAFLFLCLSTLFTTAVAGGEEKVHNSKRAKAKKKAHLHDKCDIKNHHHHEHEPLEINLEQELTAVYMYKILSQHAIWQQKNTTEGLKLVVIGNYNEELIEKLNILSSEVAYSNSKLPFTVEIWDKTKSLNLTEYHAIFIGNTDTDLFRNIAQIAHQNDIITFSSLKANKAAILETTVQFLVINNKLKFSLAREAVGKLIEEDLWKKSYKL